MSKLSIKNLDLYYGDFKALKDVNLEIPQGQFVGIIGMYHFHRFIRPPFYLNDTCRLFDMADCSPLHFILRHETAFFNPGYRAS